ncbi:tetratricopeptide repeat-containing glycosyltransferase family protein [Gammaproteobacteria bacterium]|nr:tetratricopeptide repeat-containing glycosyltransferase family protein [Gammaproteobacteria bacterium]
MPPPNHLVEAMKLHDRGELSEAAECYRNILESNPDDADAWHLLGVLSHQQQNNDLALKLINLAIEIRPNIADFHNNLGKVHWALGDAKAADIQYHQALKLNPVHVKALNNLASLLRARGQFSSAVECARRAVSAGPKEPEAHNNLGNALRDINLIEDAIAAYYRAIELAPNYALVHWNLSLALLSLGQYRDGFKEMMWRWKWDGFPSAPREFDKPLLQSLSGLKSGLNGKRILLHAEQGLGDTIHFIRYAALLHEIGAYVIFECPEELVPLLEGSELVDQIVLPYGKIPKFDFHAPLLDLPFLFKTHGNNIPRPVPYLAIPKEISKKWQERINKINGFKVGLNWQGNVKSPVERFRGLPPGDLKILSSLENVAWFSLQKGPNQVHVPKLSDNFQIIDTGSETLVETAGLIQALDLIITSDTAIAHLAGSLGKPVWVLLHHAPDWRWRTIGSSNLWYPSARLFRQVKPGQWESVIEEVLLRLRNTI